ncbi:cysteine hydrolase [Caulobacter mirabilis]|uniref:Cysteine hydrolase n=1 Tax=Caulobacter mirabilis TaxID=69666 RepID=A0A2D2B3R0_9CAUL|nr:cysteine hydrolase [Caulobacter mirabilis]
MLLIDLQQAIDDPRWARDGPRNNPGAETNVAALLARWRALGRAVIHVRHDSTEPGSTYRPGQPGHAFKPEAAPLPGEPVVGKRVNSAFVDTGLEERLRTMGVSTLTVAGVITNNSVETTVRHAANLGFEVSLVEDACFTFARRDHRGLLRSAQEVHDMSLANIEGEYARVVVTADLLEGKG